MRNKLPLGLLFAMMLLVVGCPGNRTLDKKANEKLWAWVEQQDSTRWDIIGAPQTNYNHIIVAHEFRPTRLNVAIKADEVNPYHQRNLLEQIAREWQKSYPANLKPRFKLKVELFDTEINNDKSLGWTEIDQDANVDTHHGKTQDKM